MDRFQAMQVFVRVVEANSFTRAADILALPRTTVTTIIQNLERHLGVRLLNRTTRRISLTPDGAAYYKHSTRILAEVEETEACFQDAALRPQGRLRIDVPACIGRLVLIPALCEFHQRYPDVELVIGMGERRVDLVQEAVDCVIRSGPLEDSSLVARRIGTFQTLTCAAPSYLEREGVPHTLADLERHYAVHYFGTGGRNCSWDFVVDGKEQTVDVPGIVSVNDLSAHVACGVQGFGLIQTARYIALPHLQSGELVEVLPQWKPSPVPISLLYLQSRQLSPKVRVFSDWVAELFARCPLLSGRDENDADYGACGMAVQQPELSPEAAQATRHRVPLEAPEFVM
ncbi:LysR family transcriptional regulator [Bordetella genomosp. 5]|uniref:LysR family transcriptional regulator n=1 Tax=Bordetella genomosp. 5 TaxID=1395608 RepID=A0A261T3C4_9BORD|nr:LysR family transcriptional regulator [Bordetella genomosp. 5]OZI36834.1 LysR family transcriptional regulator [Bordetella genomosp. 5]OZI43851.1 LysR family transcriptional regulator [Bordetella genomosp. 5]